jgi:hypothetical protein
MSRRGLVVLLLVAFTLGLAEHEPLALAVVYPAWFELGPALGGRLDGIVASPTDPNVLLVASPGGGVWRTAQGGGSWQRPENYGLGDFSVFHLEWDRIRPDRLLAVAWSDLYANANDHAHSNADADLQK